MDPDVDSAIFVSDLQDVNKNLLFLLDDRKIRIHLSDYWIRIREALKYMDPTDPDPQQRTGSGREMSEVPR
jgi:hypothetical protein